MAQVIGIRNNCHKDSVSAMVKSYKFLEVLIIMNQSKSKMKDHLHQKLLIFSKLAIIIME